MPHIGLPEGVPGIGSGFAFRPETAAPMRSLAHVLLFEPGPAASLPSRDRELIAAYVSSRNQCYFCHTSHAAAATHHADGNEELTKIVCADPETAPIPERLKALLAIAGKVQKDGKLVTPEDIARARGAGATDLEIHDTVLIASAFCMYNRYVDGLGTWQPRDKPVYDAMGAQLAAQGYANRR